MSAYLAARWSSPAHIAGVRVPSVIDQEWEGIESVMEGTLRGHEVHSLTQDIQQRW